MAFNFGFSGDDMDVDQELDWAGPSQPSHEAGQAAKATAPAPAPAAKERPPVPSRELSLDAMLAALPDRISYSTIRIPPCSATATGAESEATAAVAGTEEVVLPRRDLFDARFQILHERSFEGEGEGEAASAGEDQAGSVGEDDAVVGTESDLIPGLYEGGLKTWECSLDLVSVLSRASSESGASWLQGKRVVELGCGTALPSLYLFQLLLRSKSTTPGSTTTLHLCDFNSKVLELVTLPNLLLIFHFCSANSSGSALAASDIPPTGEVDLTPELIAHFKATLSALRVQLRFHAGPWEGVDLGDGDGLGGGGAETKADLILTSETTYNLCSVGPLVRVLSNLSRPTPPMLGLTHGPPDATCVLVSTKNYYFGLGGGVHAFLAALQEQEHEHEHEHEVQREAGEKQRTALRGVWHREVLSVERGVARCVLSVGWERQGR